MPEYCDIPVINLYIYMGRLKLKLQKSVTVILFSELYSTISVIYETEMQWFCMQDSLPGSPPVENVSDIYFSVIITVFFRL